LEFSEHPKSGAANQRRHLGWEAFEDAEGQHQVRETYWRTRHTCIQYLRQRLKALIQQKQRVFIGFDFAYGYPSGFAEALNLTDTSVPPGSGHGGFLGDYLSAAEAFTLIHLLQVSLPDSRT
jgi:hypothetical protein